jgi:hypothetical protein
MWLDSSVFTRCGGSDGTGTLPLVAKKQRNVGVSAACSSNVSKSTCGVVRPTVKRTKTRPATHPRAKRG